MLLDVNYHLLLLQENLSETLAIIKPAKTWMKWKRKNQWWISYSKMGESLHRSREKASKPECSRWYKWQSSDGRGLAYQQPLLVVLSTTFQGLRPTGLSTQQRVPCTFCSISFKISRARLDNRQTWGRNLSFLTTDNLIEHFLQSRWAE